MRVTCEVVMSYCIFHFLLYWRDTTTRKASVIINISLDRSMAFAFPSHLLHLHVFYLIFNI